jgi:hypothetical protein
MAAGYHLQVSLVVEDRKNVGISLSFRAKKLLQGLLDDPCLLPPLRLQRPLPTSTSQALSVTVADLRFHVQQVNFLRPASSWFAHAFKMLLLDYQNVLIESLLKDRFSGYSPHCPS